jgi:hypothetical protein
MQWPGGGLRGEKEGKTGLVGGEKLMVAFLVVQGRPMSGWWRRWWRRRDKRRGGEEKKNGNHEND